MNSSSDSPQEATPKLPETEGGQPPGSVTPKPWVPPHGPIAWMAQNAVAANLLMLVLVVGGLFMLGRIRQEVFPEFALDMVVINIPYPGASPSEVEQGVLLVTEEAVRSVDGVKEVRSTASESIGVVTVELMLTANADRALADIKSAVDRVTSYPRDIERPVVSLAQRRTEVISVVVFGDQPEKALRTMADQIREDLVDQDDITVVELSGVRPLEISVEVPREHLRRYGLTLDQVAARIGQASIDMPGGSVKTSGGEILIRTTERRNWGEEYSDIVVLSRPDGSDVKLGQIATVRDDFRETDQEGYFNGKRAAMVKVFRVGDQKPLEIAESVKRYVSEHQESMPTGVGLAIWSDLSEIYGDRISLLLRNGVMGFVLVLIVLGLFLEIRLAFWVTLGIPISFIGSLLLMPMMDASINMISLFAFIVVLGIVVDDAIVVGEAVYKRRTEGVGRLQAAIEGAREVGMPVVFAVLTTVIAFAPLMFVPGVMGKFFRFIPIVVIAILTISLAESLFVLPAHLAHSRGSKGATGIQGFIREQQQRFSRFVEWLIEKTYVPLLERAVARRYLTLSVAMSLLIGALGIVAGGHVNVTPMPKVDGDIVVAEVQMPYGTAVDDTRVIMKRILGAAQGVLDEHQASGAAVVRGVFSQVGSTGAAGGRHSGAGAVGGHVAEVAVFLVPLDQRPTLSSSRFAREWRARLGEIPGAESLRVSYNIGMSAGAAVDVELSHREIDVLEIAAADVARRLKEYSGVFDIDDGFSPGKEQLDFTLKPAARALGLTETEMGRQLRSAFYGAEAARQQRGRDELRTYVRLPKNERSSEHDVEQLIVRTPNGGEIPLNQAAQISRGRAYTAITRRDGRRIVSITADVDTALANADKIVVDLRQKVMPEVLASYPGLSYSMEGEHREMKESMSSLMWGFLAAAAGIFAVLGVVFRSYIQPLIIMMVIPFGVVGALSGHVVMGYDLSLMSMMGLVALSGVVVNDSLILVVAINEHRKKGASIHDAIVRGGARRFRPIILTSLTTFFGLMPMILETSVQARFLIPMAISLGYGVLFATFVTLLLVPAAYAIVDDTRVFLERIWRPRVPLSVEAQKELGVEG